MLLGDQAFDANSLKAALSAVHDWALAVLLKAATLCSRAKAPSWRWKGADDGHCGIPTGVDSNLANRLYSGSVVSARPDAHADSCVHRSPISSVCRTIVHRAGARLG